MNRRVSMRDIALELSISVDAVSKALRDSKEISEATKKRVRETARKMGYVKNSLAVSLQAGKSNNIAIFMNGLLNPYFAIMCDKIIRELANHDYLGMVFVVNGFTLQPNEIVSVFSNQCSAVISLVEPTEEVAETLIANHIPLYLIGIKPNKEHINYAITDDYMGGKKVAQFFLENGYKKAIYVTNSPSETSTRRFNGFMDEAKKDSTRELFSISIEDSEEQVSNVIDIIVKNNIDFVFCFSDYLALFLRNNLEKKHFYKDIMIFGFDNISEIIHIYEPINSVSSNINLIIKDVVEDLDIGQKAQDYTRRMEKEYSVELSIYTRSR